VILRNGTVAFTNHLPGITPVCFFNSSDADNACKNIAVSSCITCACQAIISKLVPLFLKLRRV
jgi:hypothetical protein